MGPTSLLVFARLPSSSYARALWPGSTAVPSCPAQCVQDQCGQGTRAENRLLALHLDGLCSLVSQFNKLVGIN